MAAMIVAMVLAFIVAASVSGAGLAFVTLKHAAKNGGGVYYLYELDENTMYGRLLAKRKVTMKDAWCVMLPSARACVATAILLWQLYTPLAERITVAFAEDSGYEIAAAFGALASLPAYWGTHALFTPVAFARRRCKTCGAVFSYVKIGSGEMNTSTSQHTSEKSGESTIGHVYVGGQKVGDVKSKSSWNVETTVKTTTFHDRCECVFCKTQKELESMFFRDVTKKIT